ncbi:hypothetical protein [Inconstantimicrobium porci]|uniref:Uncharacterized protein n=1 Tax=Inconstantimicrobium porci TaxID=2652291 RepID=A0A7X2T0E6_9CLOT|nr:hypothetical protein [Inconstantimicrobium porci]MDD6770012.1 hypothetical protein [Inconstantimicrobium porci]MSR90434.1 hypothetical protein [Inconstantimicrobium porci]
MAKVIIEVNALVKKELIGRMVLSEAGHDKGDLYIIIGEYSKDSVLLVNGSTKTTKKPKLKKFKHLSLTDVLDEEIQKSIHEKDKNLDLIIKRFLKLNGNVKEG